MALIGCNNFHYSVMKTADTSTTAPAYDDSTGMTAIPNLVHCNVNPATNTATLYADNGPAETATTISEVTVEVETADIPLKDLAALLGHTYDETNNSILAKMSDTAPYVAIAFASQKSDDGVRLVKLFKGKFHEPNEDARTKGQNVSFATKTITGTFVQLANDSSWKLTEDVTKADADTKMAAFFKSVLKSST